jgi:hypothetical protein
VPVGVGESGVNVPRVGVKNTAIGCENEVGEGSWVTVGICASVSIGSTVAGGAIAVCVSKNDITIVLIPAVIMVSTSTGVRVTPVQALNKKESRNSRVGNFLNEIMNTPNFKAAYLLSAKS